MKSFSGRLLAATACLIIHLATAAAQPVQPWVPAQKPDATAALRMETRMGHYFHFDVLALQDAREMYLPMPGGGMEVFTLLENTTFHPDLAAKFPEVRLFDAVSTQSRHRWGKVSVTPAGFHAMIFIPGGATWFIDPAMAPGHSLHVAYARTDFHTSKVATCHVTDGDIKPDADNKPKSGQPYNSCQRRNYRLALAATGEYTIFHGGSVPQAMAAMGVTMNRVNGIYERDFAVVMTLIPNNEILVYTNPATDPYTNGNAGAMLNENQINVNAVIGAANYDIGHVFGTNSGGVAGFGVTCVNNSKARGVTGSSAPIGDPFDVDYVAHEMGHQFGASHSFNNSCGGNRSDNHAVEPGSGSTIMAYAGICNPNVQSNSDDHFHGINMRQIGIRIGNDQCPVVTSLNNTMPQITTLPAEIFVPISTPFSLTAPATDAEGDALTWCWEQMNNEITQQPPQATAVAGPNFRSFSPVPIPTRHFPRLQTIASNSPTTWERLPSVTRVMNFRVSVRDNAPGGGCTQWADVQVSTTAAAGPFVVTAPNTNQVVWQGLSYQPVTWNVANTTVSPIHAELVNIYLSTNSGLAFPILLAENVPNNGAAVVLAPNVATTQARVMVQNAEGTFFDMSDFNFTINVIENGFAFETETFTTSNCQGGPLSYNFVPVAIGDFAGPIALSVANVPPGATAVLSSTEALPSEPVTLTLTPGSATPAGTYTFSVTGAGAGFENSIQFAADVIANEPIPATPAIPENGAVGVDVNTTLSWTANAGPTETYSLEVATDAAFTNVVFAASGLSANETFVSGLESATQYFWRLHNTSACGASQPGEAFSFTTFVCTATAATGEAQNIPTGIESTAVSAISITQEGTVGAVKVKDVQGVHPNISDLLFRLRSPMGTVVDLASGYCGLAVTLFGNQTIAVSNPPSVAGTYAASLPAGFGPGIGAQGLSGIAVLANDGGAADQLCDPAINAAALNGKIALAFRGGCNFVTKVLNAQNAGAIAAIIINNQGTGVINMGGTSNQINIPAVMIGQADGQALLAAIGANAANFNLSFDDWAPGAAVTCPATTGNTYQPAGALSTLVGEEAAGDWLLEVVNLSGQTQGTLQGWSLELCYQSVLSTTQAAALPQVKAWPNPTGSDLHIGAGLPISFIEVSDPAGRVVLRKSAFGESRTLLPMAALGNGLYLVTLRGDGWSRTLRVVKAE